MYKDKAYKTIVTMDEEEYLGIEQFGADLVLRKNKIIYFLEKIEEANYEVLNEN